MLKHLGLIPDHGTPVDPRKIAHLGIILDHRPLDDKRVAADHGMVANRRIPNHGIIEDAGLAKHLGIAQHLGIRPDIGAGRHLRPVLDKTAAIGVRRPGHGRLGRPQDIQRFAALELDHVGKRFLLERTEIAGHVDRQQVGRNGADHQIKLGKPAGIDRQRFSRLGNPAVDRFALGIDADEGEPPIGTAARINHSGQRCRNPGGLDPKRADVPAKLLRAHLLRHPPDPRGMGNRLQQDPGIAENLVPGMAGIFLVAVHGTGDGIVAAAGVAFAAGRIRKGRVIPGHVALDHPGVFVGQRGPGIGIQPDERRPRIRVFVGGGGAIVPELGNEHRAVFRSLRQMLEHQTLVVIIPAVGRKIGADPGDAVRRHGLVDPIIGLREIRMRLPPVALHRPAGLRLPAMHQLVRIDEAGTLAGPAEMIVHPHIAAARRGLDRRAVLDAVAAHLRPPADHGRPHRQPFRIGVVDQLGQVEHPGQAVLELLPLFFVPLLHLGLVDAMPEMFRFPDPPLVRFGAPPGMHLRPQHHAALEVVEDLILRHRRIMQPHRRQIAVERGFVRGRTAQHHDLAGAHHGRPLAAADLLAIQIPILLVQHAIDDQMAPAFRTLEHKGDPDGGGTLLAIRRLPAQDGFPL